MAKAILVIDMPEECGNCELVSPAVIINGHKTWLCHGVCPSADLSEVDALKPDWCPLIPVNGWIEEEYERPNNNRDVLILVKGNMYVGYYEDGSWMIDCAHQISGVTHWRELPEEVEE